MRRVHGRIALMAFGLLVMIMSFTGFVNYMTFADNYHHSLVNTYAVAGNETVRKIEYALRYGKPIDNYYGMQDTLQELKDLVPGLDQVYIVAPGGDILYDTNGFVRDSRLQEQLLKAVVFEQGLVHENLSYQFYQEEVYIFVGINDSSARQIASLLMVFEQSIFQPLNSHFFRQLVGYLTIIVIISLILLSFIIFQTKLVTQDQLINKKKLLITLIVVIGAAQLAYSGINYSLFKNAYLDLAYTSKDFLQNIIGKNIAGVYAKGLNLQNIAGLDQYLSSIKDSLPQIADIRVVSPQSGTIAAEISGDYINQQMFKTLLDMFTVLAIAIFFMVEITLLAVIIMIRGSPRAASQSISAGAGTSHSLVRGLAFFVNLCACMSLTFVPLVMKKLYVPIGGLSKDVVLGLPLSAEMLGGVLAIILAGWWISRQGWRAVLYLGALFLVMGNLWAGFSNSAIMFVLARLLAGLGLGLMMMSIRSLVVSLPDSSRAIAEFSAGAIAGLNCSLVIGGMLADRIGYGAVFYLAAVLVVIPLIFVRRLMTGFEIAARETSSISALRKFINFIVDKKAIVFLLCIFIPYFISGAFLDYYFPLFASSNGLSQSDISRGFLLNGLFIIYLGPVLTGFITVKLGGARGMIVSMSLVVCALAGFVLFGTVPAAFATLILLGIAEGFGVSLKTTYFLNLKGLRDLEISKGMAYYSGLVNVGRMAGPMVFGLALSLGMRMGVGLISLGILILLLIFAVFTRFQPAQVNTSQAA